jgi:hypothetical protein
MGSQLKFVGLGTLILYIKIDLMGQKYVLHEQHDDGGSPWVGPRVPMVVPSCQYLALIRHP